MVLITYICIGRGFVLIAVVPGSQTNSTTSATTRADTSTTDDGFLETGFGFGGDIGIVVGAVLLLIIIVVIISVSIYCCVMRKKKEEENVQPQLTLNGVDLQQMSAESPKSATFGPAVSPYQPIYQQQPMGMPTQSQLQQQLLPITQFPVQSQQQVPSPIPNPPPEPIENQPYFGALQSSLEPYLAQAELAEREQDLKDKKRKKKKHADIEPEKPFIIYDCQPIVPPSSIASSQQPPPQSYPFDQTPSTPYQQPDQRIISEPQSTSESDYPYGQRSFLPYVALSPHSASTNVYSLSQRVDHL
ncbi:unnamed protein product [Anisakis simplex]|uniref:Uncharacterized protein n=1 Tax=Anisakis simplex TaxID=6269 RepID=A0A0M3J0N7_ANISI|nr:unnamed protein product [Anisakis simplex]